LGREHAPRRRKAAAVSGEVEGSRGRRSVAGTAARADAAADRTPPSAASAASGCRPRWFDHTLGLLLCAAYVSLLLHTSEAIGLSRDEGIYVDAASVYAGWLEQAWPAPSEALSQAGIDRAFQYNHEHPPLFKLLFGIGHLLQQKLDWFSSESQSFRFAGMLSAGLLLWLIYIFGTRWHGRAAGLFAALTYALLPRPFYHAHLNAFDVPITLLSTAVTYGYWRSLTSRRWALLTGLTFGLALLTKHNSWILPCIFVVHFGLASLVERRARRRERVRRLRLFPLWLIAMLLLGPLLFLLGWPWLWHDTLPRLRSYAAFHLHHEYYNIEYFGVNYFWPPFPSSYAWVMTAFTVPLSTLACALGGIALALRRTGQELVELYLPPSAAEPTPLERDPTQTSLLLLGALLAPLVVISWPTTPIFGGTKHWFPAYPFLALFAGRAFAELIARLPRARGLQPALAIVAGGWLLAPAALETAHSHPFALSHYTALAGGPPGAAEKGMNRQFWGFTTRSLVPYLRQVLPNGGTLYICDTIYRAFDMLIRDGHLPPSFRATGDIALADYALVHHEKHFAEVDQQIWTTYGSVQPTHVLLYDGVPIISVYKNPRR
jgi:4-amino-4-deoxy-L-arabinose transferase-like glycosyltransferase